MKSYGSPALLFLLFILVSTSCSKNSESSSSPTAAALTTNTALKGAPTRPFERHMLSVAGQHTLTDYILPDVRARMDEESTGDSDAGYDPSTLDPIPAAEESGSETAEEAPAEDLPQNVGGEDDAAYAVSSDRSKFLWARKSFGEAVKASPTDQGVIVLYADENIFDVSRLMELIQAGRNKIAEGSEIGTERIQVVFGGYRGVPQVELWVMPEGSMPEFKVEDRTKASEPEN